ncbi:MAG: hypothetical protein H8E66_06585 [Planctomycetes bacterium]|nr:hypothetical protein [Planctomycetota bacterium]
MRIAIPVLLLITFIAILPAARADDAAKAQKLIDRAIKATCGNNALAKTKNSITDDAGVYYGMGEGLPYTGRYVMSIGDTNRYRMEIIGQFVMVTDGDKAWGSFGGMTIDSTGAALDAAKEGNYIAYAMSLIPLQKPNDNFKLSLAGTETIEDEECAAVSVDHAGMPTLTMWFSNKTGLIKKTKYKTRPAELEFQAVDDETIFHEYGKFEGIKSPIKMTIYRAGKKFVESNPQKVTYPATVDDKEFKKPE